MTGQYILLRSQLYLRRPSSFLLENSKSTLVLHKQMKNGCFRDDCRDRESEDIIRKGYSFYVSIDHCVPFSKVGTARSLWSCTKLIVRRPRIITSENGHHHELLNNWTWPLGKMKSCEVIISKKPKMMVLLRPCSSLGREKKEMSRFLLPTCYQSVLWNLSFCAGPKTGSASQRHCTLGTNGSGSLRETIERPQRPPQNGYGLLGVIWGNIKLLWFVRLCRRWIKKLEKNGTIFLCCNFTIWKSTSFAYNWGSRDFHFKLVEEE